MAAVGRHAMMLRAFSVVVQKAHGATAIFTSRRFASATPWRRQNGLLPSKTLAGISSQPPPTTPFSTRATSSGMNGQGTKPTKQQQQQRLLDELGIADNFNAARYSNHLLRGGGDSSHHHPHPSTRGRRRRRKQQTVDALVAAARHRRQLQQSRQVFPVSAMHLGQTIDLNAAVKTHLSSRAPIGRPPIASPLQRLLGRNSIVIELPPSSSSPNPTTTTQTEEGSLSTRGEAAAAAPPPPSPKYLAFFRFGSIVGVNLSTKEFQEYCKEIRAHVTDPAKPGSERKEEFGIIVERGGQPLQDDELDTNGVAAATSPSAPPPIITGDHCVVTDLDLNGVAVISTIMAQTVALDTYNDTVDNLLDKFAAINSVVRSTGTFKSSDKGFLFKSVAQNNAIFIDMISKIRLKDRSDMAWNNTRYEQIHDGLRAEFDIDDRFDQIEYKLNLIQQNSKFFLEVLESEKTYSLEWIIVLLISVECVLMCFEMSGLGEQLFASMGEKLAKLIRGN